MMIFLDTNVVIDAIRGKRTNIRKALLTTAAAARHTISIPSIVMFELEFGVANSSSAAVQAARLANFMASGYAIVDFDRDDATVAAKLRTQLAQIGTPIGPYDLLIAAQVLRRGATLVSANTKEFQRVPGLTCVSWR